MPQQIYDQWIQENCGGPEGRLPEGVSRDWPSLPHAVDQTRTLQALRRVGGTMNDCLLVVGWGDGRFLEYLANDRLMGRKHMFIVVFPSERRNFAHTVGTETYAKAAKACTMRIILPDDEQQLKQQVDGIFFAKHQEIARLAGTSILEDHPLIDTAEVERKQWHSTLHRALAERFDSLGNDVYDTFSGAIQAMSNGDSLWKRRASLLRSRWQGKSALCIASGPSAKQHFDHIRAIQDEHLVICADSLLVGLLEHGIQPDLVCMVERPAIMARLFEKLPCEPKAWLVAPPWIHPDVVQAYGDRVYWWWATDDLYPWMDPDEPRFMTGRSSGTLTVATAALCGVAEAYLVGHDLCFAPDGSSHADSVAGLALEAQATINQALSRHNPNFHRRRLDVASNNGETAETMGVWSLFKSDIETIIQAAPQTRFVNVNIADGVGAVIEGSQEGALPEAVGTPLDKQLPEGDVSAQRAQAYRDKALCLVDDMDAIAVSCHDKGDEIGTWKPLQVDEAEVQRLATELDITKMCREENALFFLYIFRAALHNLMLRMHMNTYVHTMAERNWNQSLVMLLFARSMEKLVARLRPELDRTLEVIR